ncbi:hypothetical protein KSP40_PGU014548 [Platanthera guangdongensis]|uniref:Uncharacterized protein n=1 Tax=Platanthera guangdongensis TaxID=2320717 RepID=A0ABR2MUK9_9ASPA
MDASLGKPIFRGASFPSRRPTLSTQYSRQSATGLMDFSVPFLKLPSRSFSTARRWLKLPVFSPFAGPSRRRRNSLREKLLPRQEKVSPSPGNSGLTEHERNVHDLSDNFDGANDFAGAMDSKKFDFSRKSALWDKLENWVDRYREDSEFWGIGTGPIFTIFQNSDGNIARVSVDEDEILKRSRIQALSMEGDEESGELKAAKSMISRARIIAREIEIGAYTMPRNSSIAKFVSDGIHQSSSAGVFHAFSSRRESLIRIFPRIGLTVLCCLCVLGAARKLFAGHNDVELTREEAEMLRRKKKSRMEREELQRSCVEVLQNGNELPLISGAMPQLDRDELMKNIAQAKKMTDVSVLSVPPGHSAAENLDFEKKVREIRDMVRTVREAESQNQSSNGHIVERNDHTSITVDSEIPAIENNAVDCPNEEMAISIGEFSQGESLHRFEEQETSVLKNSQKFLADIDISDTVCLSNKDEVRREEEDSNSVRGAKTKKRGTPKVITSLKEANEYLSTKGRIPVVSRQTEEPISAKRAPEFLRNCADRSVAPRFSDFKSHGNDDKIENLAFQNVDGAACLNQNHSDHKSQNKQVAESKGVLSYNSSLRIALDQVDGMMSKKLSHPEELDVTHDEQPDHVAEVGRSECAITRSFESDFKLQIPQSSVSTNMASSFDKCRENDNISQSSAVHTSFNSKDEDALKDISSKAGVFSNSSSNSMDQNEKLPKTSRKNWVEDNFQQFDSIIEKIRIGFQDNYMLAKVKAQENPLSSAEIGKLSLWGEDEELEWMKDENLLEIVFQVRENELAGRDPFYSMDAEDQQAFFHGLERKAEKVNEKLAGVHEWIHSKIENLDYGTDGIGLDDPLEKIIPRWKGPPIDQDPEFLEKFIKNGSSVLAENIRNLDYISGDKHYGFQKSENIPNSDSISPNSPVNNKINLSKKGTSTTPKTLIECSDGSSRAGKKKMKEQWATYKEMVPRFSRSL